MQDAEEQDTCRICSAPAEVDQPLFHPCKCSGTIKYIHQDCLTTWLSHSKKKTCDVCKHSYSFKKVYAPDMPSTLPPLLLIRKLVQQALFAILFGMRGILVGTIWLAALPWATVWTWRMYFSMGESTAWWISGGPRPVSSQENPFYYNIQPDGSTPPPTTFLGWLVTHPLWIALSGDIFTGQIIASLIVLTFVAVFLLREWISQHARPGIFEDEELLPDDPPLRIEFPVGQNLRPMLGERNPLDEALARRQIETMRAVDALRARDGVNGHLVGDDRLHGRSPIDYPRKGKGRRGKHDRADSDLRATTRRKLASGALEDHDDGERESEEERLKRQSFSRRVYTARMSGARRKALILASGGRPDTGPMHLDPKFRFTFKADPTAENLGEGEGSSSSIFPPVTLQPPRATIPFSFDHVKSASSSPKQIDQGFNDDSTPLTSSSPDHNTARRPPLPTSISPVTSRVSSPTGIPIEAPSLATYHAPEELEAELEAEAGPSRLQDGPVSGVNEDGQNSENDQDDAFMQEELLFFFDEPEFGGPSGQRETSEGETDDETGDSHERHECGDQNKESDNEDDEEDEEEEAAEAEDFVFDGWEAAEADDPALPQPVMPDVNPVLPAPEAPGDRPPAGGGIPLELAEELEGNIEDDMEGAMEAIGMRGPLYGVLQNAALMIFVLDTAIGIGIWIPFTIGKSTALLLMDPPRLLQILHLPIRAIRIITDPIVDSSVFCFTELVLPLLERALMKFTDYFSNAAYWPAGQSFGQSAFEGISSVTSKLTLNVANLTASSSQYISAWTSSAFQPQDGMTNESFSSAMLDRVIDLAEPQFTWLGLRVRLASLHFERAWIRLAIGEGPADRTFAILLGYGVVGILLAIYLNVLTVGNARSAGRAFKSAVRQQLLVLKVAAFIFIELVAFPLSCGIVLDLCTVWLFREANLASRVGFFVQAPLTAIFYHWVAGTMFMYAFAVLLSGCRTVMRSGAMWFIKDPQDQNSHPIRDILDRPTLTQLRKICVSGVLYSCVVVCVVASVAGLLLVGSKSILPFRWKNREPFSNVPVDLLFLHLVLPYTMHYFRPKKALRESATILWKALARKLRLTSYFFGSRHTEEECSRQWSSLFRYSGESQSIADGTFRRVPATDNLSLPRDMRATVRVTEDGKPVDSAASQLMEEQNAEVEKAKRNLKDEFIVVYVPPAFGYRVLCFIALLWVIGAVLLGIAIALPILLGRRFFEFFTTRDVHDGYSLIAGFYLLWGFYLIGCAIDRLDKNRQRSLGDRNRADLPVLVIKRGLLWVAKSAYMALFLGIIIPTLISLVIDLYVIFPIRFTIDPQLRPRVRVVETWALGLLYVKIAMHANRIQPANRISRGIQHIMLNGWTRSDPMQATKEVIGPVVGGLVGMIVFPGAVFRTMQYCIPNMPLDDRFIFMHIYPGIFMLAGLVRSATIIYGLLSSWSQSVRDKEFLVEMRLRNHEPEKSNSKVEETELDE